MRAASREAQKALKLFVEAIGQGHDTALAIGGLVLVDDALADGLQCYTMANTESARRMVSFHL